MSRNEESSQGDNQRETSSCYCNGSREVGTLELLCSVCSKWFHGKCLKDLKQFKALPFMIRYNFMCKDCSPFDEESWLARKSTHAHMTVSTLANLIKEICEEERISMDAPLSHHHFFDLSTQVFPYMKENWGMLTSMPPKENDYWHEHVKCAVYNSHIFKVDPEDENRIALSELDLAAIGPTHEAAEQNLKKKEGTKKKKKKNNQISTHSQNGKRTEEDCKRNLPPQEDSPVVPVKKYKCTDDKANNLVNIPFTNKDYGYHLVERDGHVYDKDADDPDGTAPEKVTDAHFYRIVTSPVVTLSPNDRAHQLRVTCNDLLSITGVQVGYCMARATHSVAAGTWYYEVKLTKAPGDSAVRIGWAQHSSPLQVNAGFTKLSYGWRSKYGTKFHDGCGKKYYPRGYKKGDVLGCLISLPFDPFHPGPDSSKYLPNSGKDRPLIDFKKNPFFEQYGCRHAEEKKLKPFKGSYVEFFCNGVSCGRAFTDIYRGFYFPAVSLFHDATLTTNFGPSFTHPPPPGARAMSERAEELAVHQTMSDMLYLVENNLYRDQNGPPASDLF